MLKKAVVPTGSWIWKISSMSSVGVKDQCRFTIISKWKLRISEEKCVRVVGVSFCYSHCAELTSSFLTGPRFCESAFKVSVFGSVERI